MSIFVETASKDSFPNAETIPHFSQCYFLKVILLGYPEFRAIERIKLIDGTCKRHDSRNRHK